MKRAPSTFNRLLALVILTAPLLSLGTCSRIAIESVLDGAFAGLNSALIDEVKDQLGLTMTSR